MKFGILGAMPQEVALMARSMELHRTVEAGMRTFYEGTWEGQDVVLVYSRIGKVSAANSTMLMLERFGVSHVIFTGVAGAVSPALKIGDVVIANQLVQHDMDASPLPAFQRFEIPLLGKVFFEAALHREALEAARQFAGGEFLAEVTEEKRASFGIGTPNVHLGMIGSGDQFLADPERTAALREALPELLCTEMEGAAVAQVCHEMGGVPCAVIRVISDQADHSAVVDFTRFINEVAEYLTGGIVRTMLQSFPRKSR